MHVLGHLFRNNREWAAEMRRGDPDFFRELSAEQSPEHLWIGCSDSRVPANQIVGLVPGDMFVHRNVANVVAEGDVNGLSVIQFAVEALGVRHIIVCGHYGCGGVLEALREDATGPVRDWLAPVREVRDRHQEQLDGLEDEAERHERLCELNVVEQVFNVARTEYVRGAWADGRDLSVHGWIYGLQDGLLKDLGVCVTEEAEVEAHPDPTRDPTTRGRRLEPEAG